MEEEDFGMDELTPERAAEMLDGALQHHMCALPQMKGRWEEERWVVIVRWIAKQAAERLHASGIRFFSKRTSRPGDHYKATGWRD
jgi:uncharacterized Rossmann fold enzyme